MALEGIKRPRPRQPPAKPKGPATTRAPVSLKTALAGANPLAILQKTAAFVAARTPKPTDPFADLANLIRGAGDASASSDSAASALNAQLQREGLAEQTRQFNEDLAFRKRQAEFQERDTLTQRLMEAAGLATTPTGAIQLAFLSRGAGVPTEQIRGIFQNLPYIQALLQGKTLPGFGLPEQLGGASARIPGGNVTTGGTFGLTLPSDTGMTEQQFRSLSKGEQEFLGALHTAETGEDTGTFFQKLLRGFIPTTESSAALAF